jgi:LmbE family N-acetylglucosaminyl deacetylase
VGSPNPVRSVAVVVAHPDDETLWAGGAILLHPEWRCRVFSLCRGGDPDRAPRFLRALEALGATGEIADLDDGPEQYPLPPEEVARTALSFLKDCSLDLLITHGPRGEYTSHRRHVEVSQAVLRLWSEGAISPRRVWLFAYDDGGGAHLPQAVPNAPITFELPPKVRERKRSILLDIYGFAPDSWEARTSPAVEAFWELTSPAEAARIPEQMRSSP